MSKAASVASAQKNKGCSEVLAVCCKIDVLEWYLTYVNREQTIECLSGGMMNNQVSKVEHSEE